MEKNRKIMIVGGTNSGKDIILRKICEKTVETVAMEYGNALFEGLKLHFFSVPSPERFGFMYQVLSKDIDGAIILVEEGGLKSNELEAANFYKRKGLPYVIIAYTESEESIPVDLNFKEEIPLIYTDNMDEEDIHKGVKMLLEKINATRNLESNQAYITV